MNLKDQISYSRQYWEALADLDYSWAEFMESSLHMAGLQVLPREECKEDVIDV